MYGQVDAEDYVQSIMEEILDYRKYVYVFDKEDMYITTKSGNCRIQR